MTRTLFARPELFIRPWVPVTSIPTIRPRTAPQETNPEASIEWGATAEFTEGDFRGEARQISFTVDLDDDDEPERNRFVYSEEGRATIDFIVVNPNDPSAYAVVRNVREIAFGGPDDAQFRLRMNPSMPGVSPGSGQTPQSPELSEM